ncbi:MAG: hypothetical protein NWF03_05735 [Candidatus Bathyarchaeota archaeon]|nr:hypothetical protein [Candidatus Bathyarchaeota archaeon]
MTIKRAFLLFVLCSLILLVPITTIQASEPGYERVEYAVVVEPTIDGAWTSEDEWTDGEQTNISADIFFRSTFSYTGLVYTQFIIEILNDDTNDAGDYWQICFDGSLDGGTAPMAGDYRIEIVGHTDLTVYEGDGSGWVEVTPDAGEITWADSISDSPASSTLHWILEITIEKTSGVVLLSEIPGLRVAVYDESNSEAGVLAWPPTEQDVPDTWGINNYTMDAIPEGLTFAVMGALSSVSLIVGSKYLRKHSKKRKQ